MVKRKIKAKDVEVTIESVPYSQRKGETSSAKMTLGEKIAAGVIFFLFLVLVGYFIFFQ